MMPPAANRRRARRIGFCYIARASGNTGPVLVSQTTPGGDRLRRGRAWLASLALSLLLVLALGAPASAAPTSYVALGDSFTAGPLIPMQIPPFGCLKSDHNYPHLAAPDLGPPAFRDASCSGARTTHMTQPQNVEPGPNPPQFDSLDANTRIVTVGIGGNDIGFSEIIENCRSETPSGQPCQDRYVVDGHDEISARIQDTAPKIDAVLQGIRQRSPKAGVHVVNYLPILPDSGPGCWPQVPITEADVPYLRAKHKELNAMLADRAAANGAGVVDAYRVGIGRDACQLPAERYVEPEVPVNAAAPYHPNLGGMQATARELVAVARRR
jgi:lysophospholipase L1-like esterase